MGKIRFARTAAIRHVHSILILMLGVLLLAPTAALASTTYPAEETANGTTVVTVGLPGTYDTSNDASALALINQYRDEANTYVWTDNNGVTHTGMAELDYYGNWSGPITNRTHLTQNLGLSFAAQIRAAEASFYTGHARPSTNALVDTFGTVTSWNGESLAWGMGTVGAAGQWYDEKEAYIAAMKAGTTPTETVGHYQQMIMSSLTTTSLGTFKVDGGNMTTVASDVGAGLDSVTLRPSGACVQNINVKTDYLSATISGSDSVGVDAHTTLSSKISDNAPSHWVTSSVLSDLPSVSNTSWSSENTTVATVDANTGVVTGVAVGTTTIDFSIGSSQKATKTITVKPGISSATVSTIANQTYTGSEIKPEPTVTLDGTTLSKGTDYTLSYANNVNAGTNTATVTITGAGSYSGTKVVTFTINKASSATSLASNWSTPYTGSGITWNGTVTVMSGTATISGPTVTYTYSSSSTGVFTSTAPSTMGTWWVKGTFVGDANHNSSTSAAVSYKITAADIAGATVGAIADQYYTGSAVTPVPTITFAGTTLVSGTDFTLTYANNIELGTATVTVTGRGSFTGTTQATFAVVEPPKPSITYFSLSSGYQGVSYSSGTSNYSAAAGETVTWSWAPNSGSSLPEGLSMDPSTGTVSGTPKVRGYFNVVVSVTNQYGGTTMLASSINIQDPAPYYQSSKTCQATEGVELWWYPYFSGAPTITYSLIGTLPDGLTFDTSSNEITGTPTTAGTYTATIRAKNSYGTTDQTITFEVGDGSPKISSNYYSGVVGDAYYGYPYASGVTPMTWELVSGSLPDGLSLSTTGSITGTPTVAGSFTFLLRVTNSKGSDTKSFTIYIGTGAPTISNSSLSTFVGASFTTNLYSSGKSPKTFALVSGSVLPPGLSISEDGKISGTPTTEGTYSFSVRVTNSIASAIATITIKVDSGAPSLRNLYLNNGTANTTFGQSLNANGLSPMTWSWEAAAGSSIPEGLTLSKAGSITGIPTVAGTYTVIITVTNPKGSASKTMTFRIDPSAPMITSYSLIPGTVGVTYSGSIGSATGMAPMSWTWEAVSGSSLPPGLTLSDNGFISGTPTQAGTYWVKLTATNAAGSTSLITSLVIVDAKKPSFSASDASLTAAIGETYDGNIYTANATSVSMTSGALPDGLFLSYSPSNSYVGISGVPKKRGTFSFTLTAVSASGETAAQSYDFVIVGAEPSITSSSSLAHGAVGRSYYAGVNAAGDPTIAWSLVSGSLPDGLALSKNGNKGASISGAPTSTGTYSFTLRAENDISYDEREFTIVVDGGAAPVIEGNIDSDDAVKLESGITGDSYSTIIGYVGSAPVSFSVDSGSLPNGLTLGTNENGATVISGTPTKKGAYAFTLKATNPYGSDTQAYTLGVSDGIEITTESLPAGSPYTYYRGHLFGTGTGDVWSISSGRLPKGFVLSYYGGGSAEIYGVTSETGTFTFTLKATDGQGRSTSRQYTITIQGGAPAFQETTLKDAQCCMTYYSSITALGDTPVTIKLKDGSSLPDGLTLSQTSSGASSIGGQPTKEGNYSFTLLATNASGETASQTYTLKVAPSTVVMKDDAFANGDVGSVYNHFVNYVVNGNRVWEMSVSDPKVVAGSLPDGLKFSLRYGSTAVSGVPTKIGTYTFTLQVTCGTTTISKQYSMTVTGMAPRPNTTSLADAVPGTAYEQTLYASGSKPITWTAVSGMPAGLTLSSDGVISGTPGTSDSGTYAITVKATNAAGSTSATVPLLVEGATPSMPREFTASGDLTKANLSWSAPEWPGTSPITGYNIYRDGMLLATVSSTTTTYADATATVGSSYAYAVRAFNASGVGQATDSITTRVGRVPTSVTLSSGTFSPVFTGSPVRFGGTAVVKNALGVTITSAQVTYTYCKAQTGIYVSTPPTTAGTWWVKGSYAGDDTYASSVSAPMSFVIGAKSISNATISGIDAKYSYSGKPLIPSPVVKVGSTTLVAGTDYTVSYAGNAGVGTATVTVTGKDNYAGVAKTTFTISSVVTRLFGDGALDTMAKIVEATYPAGSTCDTVVLCTKDGYWDALSASGVAGLAKAPVLLTATDSLSPQTATQIRRLGATKVIVVGGKAVVTDACAEEAAAINGGSYTRLWGGEKGGAAETAVDVWQSGATAVGGGAAWGTGPLGRIAFLATNQGYQDALAISPYAYAMGCPIFLTSGADNVSDGVAQAIADGGFDAVYVIGGSGVIPASIISKLQGLGVDVSDGTRLWGNGAIETSLTVANWECSNGFQADGMAIANRDGYWDALSGAALCGANRAPVLLVEPSNKNKASLEGFPAVRRSSIEKAYILGGQAVVPQGTEDSLKGYLW